MTAEQRNWTVDELTPEARRAAEEAAEAAGMPVEVWLNQLIKYVSAMELSGEGGREAAESAVESKIAEAHAGIVQRAPAEEPTPFPTPEGQRNGWAETAQAPAEPMFEPEAEPDAEPEPEPAPEPEPEQEDGQPPLMPDDAEPMPGWDEGGKVDMEAETFMGLVPLDAVDLPPNALRPDTAEVQAAIAATQKTGSLEPLVVRRLPDAPDSYEVVTGADRLEAARKLRRDEVPVIVRAFTGEEAERAGLVDRVRRRRLGPIEEARALGRLAEEAELDTEALGALVHRPAEEVQEALNLLRLPDSVLDMVERGDLTVVHARTLTRAADPEALADEIVARKLDIYQTEQLVLTAGGRPRFAQPARPQATSEPAHEDEDVVETHLLERHLSALLGLKVSITERSDVGVLAIHYVSRDQLNRLISRLNSVSGG